VLFKNKFRVATIRLKNWDYSGPGFYFVTICTKDKQHFFGNIDNEKIVYSNIGKIAKKFWLEIPEHFMNVELDEFIIMPNHIHGIIILNNNPNLNKNSSQNVETGYIPSLRAPLKRKHGSLSTVIGTFKAAVSYPLV